MPEVAAQPCPNCGQVVHPAACPHCATVLDMHDGPTPADRPAPDDRTVCWYCMRVSVWAVDPSDSYALMLRRPTTAEQREIDVDPELRRVVVAMESSRTPEEAATKHQRRADWNG